jgi:hypothetical protein
MQITTVKKKRYVLSSEDIKALKIVSSLLDDIIKDEELAEIITPEAYASVRDAQDIVFTILDFDGTEFDLS